jgi:hypothetical protein
MYEDKYPIKFVSEHPIYGQALAEWKKWDNKPIILISTAPVKQGKKPKYMRVNTRAAILDRKNGKFELWREDHNRGTWMEVEATGLDPIAAGYERVGDN